MKRCESGYYWAIKLRKKFRNFFLDIAYNQIQENASAMDDDLGKTFLSYPIPKAIVEEWEKVN